MIDGTAAYWENVAVEWLSARPRMIWRDHCDAVNSRLVERWLAPGRVGRVLKTDLFEEAVGKGLLPLLSSHAVEVAGIDISPSIVKAARRRHPGLDAVVASDVRTLPFGDDVFDTVISTSTLDHFETMDDVMAAVSNIARILKPGGRLILMMDNLLNPLVRLRNSLPIAWLVRLGLVPYQVGATAGHIALEAGLSKRNFRVLGSTAIMHCARMPAVLLSALLDATGAGRAAEWSRRRFLEILRLFEYLENWPTRYTTGYFVAVLAEKRPAAAVTGAPK
jgi:SAM-dependent methyltransferase